MAFLFFCIFVDKWKNVCYTQTVLGSVVQLIQLRKGEAMLTLDIRSREPIYSQIEKQIIKLINLGVYEVDSPLPSVRSVALELGINPNTVAKAYKNLENNGVIYTVAGKGAFVNSNELTGVHKLAIESVKASLTDAKNAGIEKSKIIDIVNQIWEEKHDD